MANSSVCAHRRRLRRLEERILCEAFGYALLCNDENVFLEELTP